jgi:hypothetical protein
MIQVEIFVISHSRHRVIASKRHELYLTINLHVKFMDLLKETLYSIIAS